MLSVHAEIFTVELHEHRAIGNRSTPQRSSQAQGIGHDVRNLGDVPTQKPVHNRRQRGKHVTLRRVNKSHRNLTSWFVGFDSRRSSADHVPRAFGDDVASSFSSPFFVVSFSLPTRTNSEGRLFQAVEPALNCIRKDFLVMSASTPFRDEEHVNQVRKHRLCLKEQPEVQNSSATSWRTERILGCGSDL